MPKKTLSISAVPDISGAIVDFMLDRFPAEITSDADFDTSPLEDAVLAWVTKWDGKVPDQDGVTSLSLRVSDALKEVFEDYLEGVDLDDDDQYEPLLARLQTITEPYAVQDVYNYN